ncbi:uncharacterized protein LOC134836663 [Culicoides brevitarsis]|uniref:uncharacterized protein LOC134836663 n=1 Tax=Culicoides brevitarsis TaxID=469753 RepID=UPI00307BFA84
MAPNEIKPKHEKLLLQTVYKDQIMQFATEKPKFAVNDAVRISRIKKMFEKGHTFSWSVEIFRIHKVLNTTPRSYILKDYDGNIVGGSFYTEELAKTNFPHHYLIERVVGLKGNKVKIRYFGFGPEHDTYEDRKDVDQQLITDYLKQKKKK